MLTKVVLEGPMGKQFGREWELAVNSAPEALRVIDANAPGLITWIRSNAAEYKAYQVICEYADGRVEEVGEDTYTAHRRPTLIRFVPQIAGASSSTAKIVVGVILIVVSYWAGGWMTKIGVSLVVSGIAQALTPQPNIPSSNIEQAPEGKPSYLFDGPANTQRQGVPVQLIYGRVLVGSQPISANLSVDQLM